MQDYMDCIKYYDPSGGPPVVRGPHFDKCYPANEFIHYWNITFDVAHCLCYINIYIP